jgi:hypothetical protein
MSSTSPTNKVGEMPDSDKDDFILGRLAQEIDASQAIQSVGKKYGVAIVATETALSRLKQHGLDGNSVANIQVVSESAENSGVQKEKLDATHVVLCGTAAFLVTVGFAFDLKGQNHPGLTVFSGEVVSFGSAMLLVATSIIYSIKDALKKRHEKSLAART